MSDFRQPEDNKETTVTDPSESGYSKPFPLSLPAISLGSLTTYQLVAGVLTALVVFYGLALATAINSLLTR
jgi:hypothetical protein